MLKFSIDDVDLKFTETFEGIRLSAYQDSGGIWTIGYGHTQGVHEGMSITKVQAEEYLREDFESAVFSVNHLVTAQITVDQFDALVDFVFNLGAGAFRSSTLLKLVNARASDEEIDAEFRKWDNVMKHPVAGLLRRRVAEAKLFNKGTTVT